MKNTQLQPYDVLLNITGASIGRCAVVPLHLQEGNVNQHVCIIRSKQCLSPIYLSNFLNSDIGQNQIWSFQAGGNREGLNYQQIKRFRVPLPPLPEQKKIASILTTVDDKIESIDKQIEQTEGLKRGLMQRLFSQGIGHTEFKDSELGRIPKEWEVVKLLDVATVERGKFQYRPRNNPKFYGGKYPFIQTGDVANSNGRIKTYSQTLNELGLEISKLFPKGTIVITIAANIGDTAIVSFDVAFPDSLIGIITKEGTYNVFLEYYFRVKKEFLNRLATVSAQKNINLKTLSSFLVPFPTLLEQKKIADILTTVDDKLESLRTKKSQYTTLKKGLMQKLLTGQIRVNTF